jgi:hypothetical protein
MWYILLQSMQGYKQRLSANSFVHCLVTTSSEECVVTVEHNKRADKKSWF